MRLRYPDDPGQLGRITSLIGEMDGQMGAIDIVRVEGNPAHHVTCPPPLNLEKRRRFHLPWYRLQEYLGRYITHSGHDIAFVDTENKAAMFSRSHGSLEDYDADGFQSPIPRPVVS